LPKEFLARLRWTPEQRRASGHVRDNSSLRADLAALSNAQMTRHGRLTTNLNEILQDSRASDADLRYDYAAASKPDVVANLRQIIDAGPGSDDRVAGRTSIDRGVGAYFHVVLYDHATKLRNTEKACFGGGEAVTLLTDSGTGIDVDARAE